MDEEAERPEEPTMRPDEFVASVVQAANIIDILAPEKVSAIASDAMRDYRRDKRSMKDWQNLMQRGIDLATMVKKDKEYPFKGASNICYPLIATAALQFNARAYPALVPSENAVKARTYGKDPQGKKAARAERVAEYMSFQLTTEIDEWEGETDKLLTQLPIVGQMFRKVWYDPIEKRPRCSLLDAGCLIVNDKVKSLASAECVTEEFSLYRNEIDDRIAAGVFAKIELEDDETGDPEQFIEHHCRLDLDGDGYKEPYIVKVHTKTEEAVSIVADFDEQDVEFETETVAVEVPVQDGMTGTIAMMPMPQEVPSAIKHIRRNTYYVDYKFLPSLTAGFHGTGLGLLLGDITDTVNSIMNMMMDAGHYASLGGGFIGSEFRIGGGNTRFRPGEFKKVSATGQDIRSSIVPMTFPGADATLYSMLGMLIDAANKLASVQDIITGDTGTKNMTATTTLALIEQGMAVFTAAYKRIFRAMKREYKLLAKINAYAVPAEKYAAFHDEGDEQNPVTFDPAQEFGAADMDIEPVADPSAITKMQEAAKAQIVIQMAEMGMVDRGEAAMRVLEASSIPDREALMPKPDPAAQEMQAMQGQMMRAQLAQAMADIDLTMAKVRSEQAKAIKDMSEIEQEDARLRFDAIVATLEHERESIGQILQAATRGMAGASGDGRAPANDRRPVPQASPLNAGGMVGGFAPAGIAPFGGATGARGVV